ncbi:VrrA/YqfQ family protein [Caldalkalibacillus thermarum]|uniref:VrrA/YqfQ family protein n=1 Tax=Caldalkalibacillus thermarum TaxID=296745 RepID=UPI001663D159|nr:VrrA/YqfQ family protein [Caldalkalibacillus thermarum]
MAYPRIKGHRLPPFSRHPAGQPIGFLMQGAKPPQPQPNLSPFFGAPNMPPQGGGPFTPFSSPSPPSQVPGFPFQGPSAPGASPPGTGGLQGLLQGLMGGSSFDLPGLMSNAQKWIGVLNQLGSVIKQAGPLLQLVQGLTNGTDSFSDDDTLTELTDDEEEMEVKQEKPKPKRKRSRVRTKGKRKRRRKKTKGTGRV